MGKNWAMYHWRQHLACRRLPEIKAKASAASMSYSQRGRREHDGLLMSWQTDTRVIALID